MAESYEKMIRDEWEKFSDEKEKFLPNIMLLGATGCGKSSLVNCVFGKKLAEVNDVSRGTTGFYTYWGKDHSLGVNLIDTRGYEMENGGEESFNSYFKSLQEKMKENKEKKPLEKIHIVWYCISVAAERIQDYDLQVLKRLLADTDLRNRVAVILTKCDEDDEEGSGADRFKQIISKDVNDALKVFEVSNKPDVRLDLEKMMEWSINQLDDADLKEAFISSQLISLSAKKKTAAVRIAAYAASAAAIGATPIPMSDAALLTPLQVAMCVHITRIYGMDSFANISKSLIGDILVSNMGKALAGGLLKLFPGIGTLVGGLINAAVASLITTALGFAISEICYNTCKKITKGEYVDMSSLFDMETIQKYIKDYMYKNKK